MRWQLGQWSDQVEKELAELLLVASIRSDNVDGVARMVVNRRKRTSTAELSPVIGLLIIKNDGNRLKKRLGKLVLAVSIRFKLYKFKPAQFGARTAVNCPKWTVVTS